MTTDQIDRTPADTTDQAGTSPSGPVESTIDLGRSFAIAAGIATAGVLGILGFVALTGDDEPAADTAPEAQTPPADAAEPAPDEQPAAADVAEPDSLDVPDDGEIEAASEAEQQAVDALLEFEGVPSDDAPSAAPEPVRPAEEIVVGTDDQGEDIVVVFEISQVCATTHHEFLDDSPSYIRWVYDAPGLADGTLVTVPLGGAEPISVPATVTGSRVVVDQGIDAYGPYPFPAIEWIDDDGHENAITPDLTHVVDEREGEPSTTCAV